jgi:hypothetical protein
MKEYFIEILITVATVGPAGNNRHHLDEKRKPMLQFRELSFHACSMPILLA